MKIHEIHNELRAIMPDWIPQNELYRAVLERYVKGDEVILDIGCGRGSCGADILARSQNVIGQDPDTQAVEQNPYITKKLPGDFDVLNELSDNSIDLAVSSWVLEHIDNPDALFLQLKRLLKPGASFIGLTPNKKSYVTILSRLIPNSLHPFLVKKIWGRAEQDTYPTRYKINTVEKLRSYAERYGFVVDELNLLRDPSYYIADRKYVKFVVSLYTKFVSEKRYEGMLFVLRKV
jgi:ubiquinone/menaquinone biosynthesis C-methylase UbiE